MPQIDKRLVLTFLLLCLALIAAGCSSSNSESNFDPDTGKHSSPNWVQGNVHGIKFIDEVRTNFTEIVDCTQCHGPNLKGGTSDVSCFNTKCHPSQSGAPVAHPVPFGDPALHGPMAKAAPSDTGGFLLCRVCHGSDKNFAGGFIDISCYGCHGVNAPHPQDWLIEDKFHHSTTDPGNANVCAWCHLNRKNLPSDAVPLLPPFTPAPAGTPPGCFNNTLCHGANVSPHPPGWVAVPPAPQPHGEAAKSAPDGMSGFSSCEACHGGNFSGGTSGLSCFVNNFASFSCHAAPSPHPRNWLPDDTYTHTTTDPVNARVCAQCHLGGKNSPLPPPPPNPGAAPGCFNNTLCHGNVVNPHPPGWVKPFGQDEPHGDAAKGPPGNMSGFKACEACHGANFSGGIARLSCFVANFGGFACHNADSPHYPKWFPNNGTRYIHMNTDQRNAPVCAQCHRKNPGTPGCFNNTLCHGAVGVHPAGWVAVPPAPQPHGNAAKSKPGTAMSGFASCETCHGANFGGGTGPSCFVASFTVGATNFGCHNAPNVASWPHPPPANWVPNGPGPYHHNLNMDTGNAPVCGQCHGQPGATTFSCFSNPVTLCH